MGWTTSPDFDKLVTRIRNDLERANPDKRFTKEGVILYIMAGNPQVKQMFDTNPPPQKIMKRIPQHVKLL